MRNTPANFLFGILAFSLLLTTCGDDDAILIPRCSGSEDYALDITPPTVFSFAGISVGNWLWIHDADGLTVHSESVPSGAKSTISQF
ncbi:MAG: hypothetical protein AAF840_05735 [Bacteroidota bacterium]